MNWLLAGYQRLIEVLQLPELTTETKNPAWTFNPSVQGSSPCGPTSWLRLERTGAEDLVCLVALLLKAAPCRALLAASKRAEAEG